MYQNPLFGLPLFINYLNTNAQISLNEYLNERKGESDYIFVSDREPHDQLSVRSVQRVIGDLADELGFELSPHILRHTSATLALQNGMEITQVQKMLGHSSVNTTQIITRRLLRKKSRYLTRDTSYKQNTEQIAKNTSFGVCFLVEEGANTWIKR